MSGSDWIENDPDVPTEKNRWKIPPIKKEHGVRLLEESSFEVMFPKTREDYLQVIWPRFEKRMLNDHGIHVEVDFVRGVMICKTTEMTWDPYVVIQTRDILRVKNEKILLARYVPYEQALRILSEPLLTYEIISLNNFVASEQIFRKRRERLIGPDGATLKALEIVSGCYILICGKSVVALGDGAGTRRVREIVEGCMKNVHPIYGIKKLMIERELARNDAMQERNWEKFLPQYKKHRPVGDVRKEQRKKEKELKKKKKQKEKEYTPFPPAPPLRQVDIELETGEYFANKNYVKKQKEKEKKEEKVQKQKEKSVAKQLEKVKKSTTFEKKESKKEEQEKLGASDLSKRISKNFSNQTQKRSKSELDYVQKKSKVEKD